MDKEQRRKQALEWAQATGKGPGNREYIDAFFAGYFNHAQTRSDLIEGHVIEEFEALLEDSTHCENLLLRLVNAGDNLPSIRGIQDEHKRWMGKRFNVLEESNI
jgi:hypothetical protein